MLNDMVSQWVLLIRSLERGGAERQVVVLAKALHARGCKVDVITFYDGGALRNELLGNGINVVSLQKRGRWDVVGFAVRLVRALRQRGPCILYSFLTVPNVIVSLLKPLLNGPRIVWGVRASNMELQRYDWFARFTHTLECSLAGRADLIVTNSIAGKNYVISRGFPADKVVNVPNGIDTSRFKRDDIGRARVRKEWGVADNELLVGLAARFDPMKDQATFIEAARLVAAEHPGARFALVGDGGIADIDRARRLVAESGISDRVTFGVGRDDMPAVFSAFDIACSSSSFGEGFSNTIAEAMACTTPCVVTDVGDSGEIVADTGYVIPPRDAERFARALLTFLRMDPAERTRRGQAARERVERGYSIERLVIRTTEAVRAP